MQIFGAAGREMCSIRQEITNTQMKALVLMNDETFVEAARALAERIMTRHRRMGIAESMFVANEWAIQGPDGVARLRADPRHKLPNPVLYRRAEAEACWRAITAEALLILGSESRFMRYFDDATPRSYPHARQVVIEGAGHMPHFEAPDALAGRGIADLRAGTAPRILSIRARMWGSSRSAPQMSRVRAARQVGP